MREELREPSTHFPGLQIFNCWKTGTSNFRETQKFPVRPTLNSQFLPSEETLTTAIQGDKLLPPYASWSKFPERKSIELNDYSPTVVGSDCFERFEPIEKPLASDCWTRLTSEIFEVLFSESDGQFNEEFQYAVISSDFLNDPDGFRYSFTGKKSIMDFHKSSEIREPWTTIPTKYGHLTISLPNKFIIQRTFDYRSTMFAIMRALKGIRRVQRRTVRLRRILATILIALHLAIQQKIFHAQYAKYKALISLKAMLKSLQELSVLSHKYHLKLKELSIYKPLTKALPNCGTESTIMKIKDLFTSCLDLLFYKLKDVTQNLVLLCSTASLAKYCEIYNLELSDLFHYFNEPVEEVEERAKRVFIAKKFLLCALLSFNYDSDTCDTSMRNFLLKAFPDYEYLQYPLRSRNFSKYRVLTENMQLLTDLTVQLTASLINHKSVLFCSGETPPESAEANAYQYNLSGPFKNRQLYMTLHSLRKVENTLIASEEGEVSHNVKESVKCQLQQILSTWQSYDTIGTDKRQSPMISPNPGFSLDVLKKKSSIRDREPHNREKRRLEGKVNFEQVDDTKSDIEYDSDNEFHNKNSQLEQNDGTAHKSQGLSELSDEELRRRLNEGISKFAVENKQGREKLRTQKSFELLRGQEGSRKIKLNRHISIVSGDYTPDDRGRPLNQLKFSSEDSIPVLYELEELMENRQ